MEACAATDMNGVPGYFLYDPNVFPEAFEAEYSMPQVSTGTSTIAVEFDSGVILGADSRTSATFGDNTYSVVINRISEKVTRMTEKIYCCRSGTSAHTQAILDLVTYHLDLHAMELDEPTLVRTAANCFREVSYNYRDQLKASFIVAGWDSVKGGQVYAICHGGMLMRQPVALSGSGSTHIYGFVDSNFRPNMSEQEGSQFLVKALTLAMARDVSSGGVIRTVTIKETGVVRHVFTEDQMEKIYDG